MKNVASKPWTLAAVVVTTMVCLAAFALVSVPVVEAQQSGASEEEIAARVRAELEARLAQVNQRILEQMRQLEAMREVDVEKLQQELQMLTENGARFRELAELSAQRAAELHSQTSEETRRRTGELTRRAMEQAEQAVN